MSDTIQIITPTGMFGSYDDEHPVTTAMRIIGVGFGPANDWCSKYGCNYENDVFMMHRYCWCEKEDGSCLWCIHGDHPDFEKLLKERFGTENYQQHRERGYYDPPQFWFKPDDFRVSWYKYIGRDMASNKDDVAGDFLDRIFATHPEGKTVEQAFNEYAQKEKESADGFARMLRKLNQTFANQA